MFKNSSTDLNAQVTVQIADTDQNTGLPTTAIEGASTTILASDLPSGSSVEAPLVTANFSNPPTVEKDKKYALVWSSPTSISIPFKAGNADPYGKRLYNDYRDFQLVWLDDPERDFVYAIYVEPNDTTAPTVSSVTPTQTTKVPLTATISATFSEEMDASTLNSPATNFKLQKLTGKGKNATYVDVTGVVVNSAVIPDTTFTKATLAPPNSRLDANSSYKAIVTTGVTDQAGNALAQEKVWSFKTARR